MKKFNVRMTYRAHKGCGSDFLDIEKVVETDDIVGWVKAAGCGWSYSRGFGKQYAWFSNAKEISNDDEWLELKVKRTTLFDGDLILVRHSRKAENDAKKAFDEAMKKYHETIAGTIVGIEKEEV